VCIRLLDERAIETPNEVDLFASHPQAAITGRCSNPSLSPTKQSRKPRRRPHENSIDAQESGTRTQRITVRVAVAEARAREGSFQAAMSSYGMRSSMSRKGNCWDNAPTESLWGSLKVGRLYGRKFAMQRQAMDELIDWLTIYNQRRLHSTLGYVSPMMFEANWHAGRSKKAA
jgi:transposase InsO family protein